MFYSNNTKRGFADTDGTLYWGTGNVFWVSPTGAVTAPSLTVPTVAGGSTAAQDLQLQSTTHPTKGKIRLGANAFYDEATGDTHFPGAGANSFRVGVGSTAGNSGVAVGPGATVANGFGVATGYQANASNFGVAIGYLASATGTNAFALGRQASATHAYACAVGFLTASTRDYEFRWGSGNPLSTAPVFALAGNSSTTRNLGVFDVQTEWVDATHATRKSRAKIGTYDFGGFREGVRMESDGAQALLSFFGGSAVARQAAIPNTSGADLATLEAEVNKLKAVIRAYNLMAP